MMMGNQEYYLHLTMLEQCHVTEVWDFKEVCSVCGLKMPLTWTKGSIPVPAMKIKVLRVFDIGLIPLNSSSPR